MNELTPDERNQLNRRRAGFDTFLQERLPVLVEFCDSLGLPNTHEVLIEPARFISPITRWIKSQDIDSFSNDDRAWLVARVGYLIGEYFVCRYSGCWFVDDNPKSKWFAHFVVGKFARFPNARVAPVHMAQEIVELSRDLDVYLADASLTIEATA